MEQPLINEQLVRRYLLGKLPEGEREQLEMTLVTDDRFYETLTALEDKVEDELIDQYLDGELTKPERDQFERVFLNTPERTQKLNLIKDLKDRVAVPAQQQAPVRRVVPTGPTGWQWSDVIAIFQSPLFGLASATALLLAISCSVWLLIRTNSLEAQLRQAQARSLATGPQLKEQLEQLRVRNEELTANLQRAEEQRLRLEQDLASLKNREGVPPQKTTPSGSPTFATVTLMPSVRSLPSSDDKIPTLSVPAGATQARLILNVEEVDPKDYKRFQVVVKKRAGSEIWRDEHVKLRARGNKATATLAIPTANLSSGQYTVELNGETLDQQTDQLGLYIFRVVTK